MARQTTLDSKLSVADEGSRLRHALSKVGNLKLENEFEGRFLVGRQTAGVRIEPGDCMRVACEVQDAPPPFEALETNAHLPGNVRFAATGGRTTLVADTRRDGELHLAASFGEIGEGLQRAQGHRPRRRARGDRTETITPESVQAVLDQLGWDEEAVLRLADGWELRPRSAGEAMPVRLAIEGHELRIGRDVVADCLGASRQAVAFQSLYFNWRLRHARLACREDKIVAETRLHAGLVTAGWLAHAARAVVAAVHHSRTTLEILASQPKVARHFEKMFLDAEEHTASSSPSSPNTNPV